MVVYGVCMIMESLAEAFFKVLARWPWGSLSVERFSPPPFQRLLPSLPATYLQDTLLLKTDNCKLITSSCLRRVFCLYSNPHRNQNGQIPKNRKDMI